ncbi:hypothetical protein EV138_1122 [Kribbella voronezhensis]|uniref:Uncharacterized protein n=1 Tax=Kribbella voronezhensis TaxID=2512212 RepID=A0A4R7T8R8_9ACTN|nr:hypothetical protein EV138_1122 [Kribbella voronezhensis]
MRFTIKRARWIIIPGRLVALKGKSPPGRYPHKVSDRFMLCQMITPLTGIFHLSLDKHSLTDCRFVGMFATAIKIRGSNR